ncbi:MAG: tetratricopeptide repeat protein [Gallionella sp.]
MMRAILMLILFAIAIPAEANAGWNRLWLNPDQRGEALLQQGDASAAANVYRDPRRKAYAEMKAGNLKQAASDLGNQHDSDSDYNRGNALAKLGDLKGALDAYDAALKRDPKNHDAQHNRDLVEQALKQKPPQQKSGQQKSGDNKQQNGKSGGKPDNQSGKGKNSGNGQQPPEKNSSPSGKNGGNTAGGNSSAQQNRQNGSGESNTQNNSKQHKGNSNSTAQSGQDQSGQGQTSQDQTGAAASRQQSGKVGSNAGNNPSPDDAAQARQDAAASLAAPKDKQGAGGNESAYNAESPPAQKTPPSEQQLSKEQWLRSIPDDPGGLLRRKFMIEYMLRQQKAQQ